MLDAAALHPELDPDWTSAQPHYFSRCAHLADELVTRLVSAVGSSAGNARAGTATVDRAAGHRGYLVGNTTTGLLAVLTSLRASGIDVDLVGPSDQHYRGYSHFFTDVVSPQTSWEFRTHVSPSTARVDDLEAPRPLIVDAAQSLGTALTAQLLEQADVLIAPLHKHIGLAAGLGIIMVRNDADLPVRSIDALSVATAGTQSIERITSALRRLDTLEDRLFNRCVLVLDDAVDDWCHTRGLRLLSRHPGPPFACVTTSDGGPIDQLLQRNGEWRFNRLGNSARFSYHQRGRLGDPPVDFTERLRRSVTSALSHGRRLDPGSGVNVLAIRAHEAGAAK